MPRSGWDQGSKGAAAARRCDFRAQFWAPQNAPNRAQIRPTATTEEVTNHAR